MDLNELLKRSPLRILEQSLHGGLKAGEIGIIAAQNGLGKTSMLVQLALDKLLQGKKVIHVSFTQHTQYVIAWYEDIFNEFINWNNLENPQETKDSLIKNRVLMNFNQDGMSADQILKSLRALIVDGCFEADAIIIDGFDFSRTNSGHIANIRAFAGELGLSVWYSCNISDKGEQYDENNIPITLKDLVEFIDVVIVLEPKQKHIALSISKSQEAHNTPTMEMKLDPRTLLIIEK